MTGLPPTDPNYTIAEDYCLGSFQNNTFQDTNENQVKRSIAGLREKFGAHNQDPRAERLQYLIERFQQMPLKQVGISDAHWSMIHLLLMLANNPTGQDGYIEDARANLSQREYLSKQQAEAAHNQVVEEQIRQINNEVLAQTKVEIVYSDSEEFSALSDEDSEMTEEPGVKADKRGELTRKQDGIRVEGQVRNRQQFFGGLPLNDQDATLIKESQTLKVPIGKPKRLNINQFLDKHFQEIDQVPTTLLDEQKETQNLIKEAINIRTFDQLQKDLSARVPAIFNKQDRSNLNPQEASYNEPLNLAKEFRSTLGQEIPWNFEMVTERQVCLDILMLLMGHETQTFVKIQAPQKAQCFILRRPIQFSHLSPSSLQSMLKTFLEMSNTQQKALFFLNGLLNVQGSLGTVTQSFVFKFQQVMNRFKAELSDLQQIMMCQAGQLTKQQLNLSGPSLHLIDAPLTLLKLQETLDGEDGFFHKVDLLFNIIKNGIMDYLVNAEPVHFLFGNHAQMQNESFTETPHEQQEDEQEKAATLDWDKIQPADRVTFLLNYLYLVIKNNEVLTSNETDLSLLREIFLACLEPYVQIMSDWVTKGELNDPYSEFFIKVNPKIDNPKTSKDEWKTSFVFRSINLTEFEDRMFGGLNNQLIASKVEISIPIFLRDLTWEILSVGKSIKIINFLERQKGQKSNIIGGDLFQVVKANINELTEQGDHEKAQQTHALQQERLKQIATEHLDTSWNKNYSKKDLMLSRGELFKTALNEAPFKCFDNQFVDIFSMPAIEEIKPLQQSEDVQMIEEDQIEEVKADKQKSMAVVNLDNLRRLSESFNLNQQELNGGYQESKECYQAYDAWKYLLQDPLQQDETKGSKHMKFKDYSIQAFMNNCLNSELINIHKSTCQRFIQKLKIQCKLQENIVVLRKVFFMEAGHCMHTFSSELCQRLDRNLRVDNKVMINGIFQESIENIGVKVYSSNEMRQRLQIDFVEEPSKFPIDQLQALDFLQINFNADWPLEIIFDSATMNSYNAVFRFLLRIKRVNHLLSQRDFWVRLPIPNAAVRENLNIKEQIIVKNKIVLNSLMHKLQLFQRELLHFTNNLEYYIKTRAIKQCCNELDGQLSQNLDESTIDMDQLIDIHYTFLMRIGRLCMLDKRNQVLRRELASVMQNVLEFRKLCKKYCLTRARADEMMSDSESDSLDDSFELEVDNKKTIEQEGIGLLKVNSPDFIHNANLCTQELNTLVVRFRQTMDLLIQALDQNRTGGDEVSFLSEAFTRLNFNNFYSRDKQQY